MITHVVAYKPRGSRCAWLKLFHSLELAEKWIETRRLYDEYWILKEIVGFHAETGCATYKILKSIDSEEI